MASASFQNAMEWETWNRLSETKWAKYLAPCRWISPCGIVIGSGPGANRCARNLKRCRYPTGFLNFKRTNYGVLDGRVVCHDYGLGTLLDRGTRNTRA